MEFNKDILDAAYKKAHDKFMNEQNNKLTNLKHYLSQKFPNYDFSNYMYIFQLYKAEVDLSFNEKIKKNFYRVWRFGPPENCPINKFIQQPTLF